MKTFLLSLLLTLSASAASAQSVTNPSFEDGTNGWAVSKMQLQGNDGMSSYKAGNTYLERWIAAPGLLGHASVTQTVTGLTNGVYRLTVAAMNISQNNTSAAQVGAWIVGNGLRTAVTTLNTYTLDFLVTDGKAEIGFVCEGASGNWVGCDNFRLTYIGNSSSNIQDAGNTVKSHANNLISTYGSDSQYSSLVSTLTSAISGGNLTTVANAAKAVVAGERAYRLRHPSGSAPTVTTRPRHARGSIWIFGRLERSGSNVVEEGFCWSTSPNPTLNDNYTTDWTDSYGKVIWMQGLTPGTMYYIRAYAMTKGGAVGYGDVIKVPTLPQGHINWYVRTDDDASNVIRASCERAFDYYWSNLTQLTTFGPNIGHVSGVPTAECSYGGWMSVGDSWSYQQPGTLMHEALHGVGVGQHWMWGDFTRNQYPVWDALRFWNNNETEVLNGDGMHLWPYGINGAHEDNGSDQLYIGNSLVCEALGEGGLPLTDGQWLLPYYAFVQDDNTKYYIKCEDKNRGLATSFLVSDNSGNLKWKEMSASGAQTDDKAAWYITFDASNQKYHIQNASTKKYIRYSSANANNGFTTGNSATDIQMKKCRVDVNIGSQTYHGLYFLDYGSGQAMEAKADEYVGSTGFSIWDDATTQRWVILAEGKEMDEFENSAVELQLDVLRRLIKGYTAAKNVSHTETTSGVTSTLNNTINTINSAISGTVTMEQALQYIDDIKSAGLAFLNGTKPGNGAFYDLTFLIENPDFAESAKGWSLDPTLNYGSIEFYEKTFDFYQILPNMPAGTYRLTVDAFQRPGANETVYNAYAGGTDNVSTYLYVNSTSQKVKNVMSAQQSSAISNGEYQTPANTYVPNNMESGSTYLNRSKYSNELQDDFAAGNLRIGLRCSASNTYYWTMADNFKLYFMGTNGEIVSLKDQLVQNGFTKIKVLPKDYSSYFFVLYDHYQDLTMVLKNPNHQGGSKSMWYEADVNPMTSWEPLWTIDSFTQDDTEYQVMANATYSDYMLQTEWNAAWNYRCSDNGGGNPGWGRTKFEYLSDGYWTIQSGVYPQYGYLGPWEGNIADDAETALNKTDAAIGHFDVFTILRGDYVKRFEAWSDASYDNPHDITYVLENPSARRRTTIGWKAVGTAWTVSNDNALAGHSDYYFNGKTTSLSTLSQTLQGLPSGYYRFSAIATGNGSDNNLVLFANAEEMAVAAANTGARTSVMIYIDGEDLQVGAKALGNVDEWVKFDDAQLEYLGREIPGYNVGTPTLSINDGAYIQNVEMVTFNFTEANSNVAGAVFDIINNSKATLFKDSKKVADLQLYISGKMVSANFSSIGGLQPASTYTLTLPAGAVGYADKVMNEAVSVTFHTPVIFDGLFYLKNNSTQKFISRGGRYATQAALEDWGLALWLSTDEQGNTTLKCFDSQLYLFDDGNYVFTDQTLARAFQLEPEQVAGGYSFKNRANGQYVTVDGEDVKANATSATATAVWSLVPSADVQTIYQSNADVQAVTAAEAASLTEVTTQAALDTYSGEEVLITGSKAEKFEVNGGGDGNGNVPATYYEETVENLVPGIYRLSVDAFQRACGFDNVAAADGARGLIYVYANEARTQLKSVMEYGSTSSYADTDYQYNGLYYPNREQPGYNALATGHYRNVVYVFVPEGTPLTFGIANPSNINKRATWAIYDNFRLERLKLETTPTGIEIIDNLPFTTDKAEVYDLQGRRVHYPAKGLYIVNGKKVFIK